MLHLGAGRKLRGKEDTGRASAREDMRKGVDRFTENWNI
jgi:hypothetical protein